MIAETKLNLTQKEVIERGLLTSGFNCVLQMPTGAGKTWLAEQAILATLRYGRRAVYLTPLRALANELVDRWRTRFQGYEVGVFTGEFGKRQAYPVPFDRARVLVMTPERLDFCTRNWRSHWGWIPEVDLLVVDELHLLGERRRGPRLEGAILRMQRLNPFSQILGLSATLGNRAELADWLSGIHFGSDWRPIPITWRCQRYQRATDKPRILREEVEGCVTAGGQSLIFVQSRRRAEALAAELNESGVSAGHHHAGLDSAERKRLEDQYRSGVLQALVSTGTLEMGLNLPARQVVLYDLQRFDDGDFVPLSTNTVWQRAGRAGRQGLDDRGEVVLIAPSWDRTVEKYARGQFDRVVSGLSSKRSLAEQLLAEVSSGLCRTRSQLNRAMVLSLAAHQHRIPSVDRTISEMVEAGMLVEMNEDGRGPLLKSTKLGRIAARQMLMPSTVAALAAAFQIKAEEASRNWTFLDLLLVCAQTEDCEPLIPVDFEELEDLGTRLAQQCSNLLSGMHRDVVKRFEAQGRKLLSIIKTSLVAREWTRIGDADTVAKNFGCYAFEVRRLGESLERILTAATAIASSARGDKEETDDEMPCILTDEDLPLVEWIKALRTMIAHGLDEQTVTLTFINGIGGTLARRLHNAGISDIEDLASVELGELTGLRGVSRERSARWIAEASKIMQTRSAFAFREVRRTLRTAASNWPVDIDPYRLRRALDLVVHNKSDYFLVSGGLEPHRVRIQAENLLCDCVDFAKGNVCKHMLAVRLNQRDQVLVALADRLKSSTMQNALDLQNLWLEGARK